MRAAELLLHCFGNSGGAPPEQAWSVEEWEEIECEAVRHGLAPLLYHRLRSRGSEMTPPAAVVERLGDVYLHSALRSATLFVELAKVLRAIRDASIEVVVLKGGILAEGVYGNAALRPMADVDLLVQVPDLGHAREVLFSLGYTSPLAGDESGHHHLPAFRKRGAIPIEVHWSIILPGFLPSIGLEGLWGSALRTEVAGVEVLALSPEHLLHHLCVHAAYNHRLWISLLQLHDVAAVVRRYPQLDWSRLEAISHTHTSGSFVYATLALARRAFPADTPVHALERFCGSEADEVVVELVWSSLIGPPRDFPRLFVRMDALPSARARAKLLGEYLFPPLSRLRLHRGFTPGRIYWSYALRLFDLVRRNGWQSFKLLFRRGRNSWDRARARTAVERWVRRDEVVLRTKKQSPPDEGI